MITPRLASRHDIPRPAGAPARISNVDRVPVAPLRPRHRLPSSAPPERMRATPACTRDETAPQMVYPVHLRASPVTPRTLSLGAGKENRERSRSAFSLGEKVASEGEPDEGTRGRQRTQSSWKSSTRTTIITISELAPGIPRNSCASLSTSLRRTSHAWRRPAREPALPHRPLRTPARR
jgi:hypothetical protein